MKIDDEGTVKVEGLGVSLSGRCSVSYSGTINDATFAETPLLNFSF